MSDANGTVRIGVYVCHCGTNIAAVVDCKAVAELAAGLAHVVVARDYKYLCSDPGQELIRQDIQEHKLNRIVVASCSPHLHEHTFRTAVEQAGLNPFFMQMVNIREHDSWVHQDRAKATEKAKDMVRAAVRRVVFHESLKRGSVPIHPDVLVVGGGIAGIHAALTLANAGKKVYLVERQPSIGGHMAMFDKTFPTLDCAACILTPKMSSVKAHPNITLWANAEVTKVDGYVGNFKVSVTRWPRYIDENLCSGCLECIEACVYKEGKFPDEYNMGLSKRKPIYLPFPQAVPQVPVIDPDTCIQFKTGKCKKTCVAACADRKAINFQQKEEVEQIEVGAIVMATGFQPFDAARTPYYGYGTYPNVYTSLEVERLVNASGPTGGDVVLRDGSKPKAIGIIHCVGSRDEGTNRWCSRVCCMYSLKLAHLLKEHTGAEVFNFYIDMRTPGKGFEEFYQKLLNEGVHFIRGRVAEVTDWALDPSEENKLVLRVEDTLARRGAPDPGGHGGPLGRHRAACRRPGRPAAVQHLLRQRGILPGAAPQAGARQHLHRRDFPGRLLPGPQGHSRHRGAGRRRRGRGAGAHRQGLRGDGTEHRLHRRGSLLRLPYLRRALPLWRDSFRPGEEPGLHSGGAVQGLRHLRGRLSFRFDPAAPV